MRREDVFSQKCLSHKCRDIRSTSGTNINPVLYVCNSRVAIMKLDIETGESIETHWSASLESATVYNKKTMSQSR